MSLNRPPSDEPDRPVAGDELDDLFAPLVGVPCVLLAVSGGADSLALMVLYARWRAQREAISQSVIVATVDHSLRASSASEAAFVADRARDLGFPHETLVWEGPKPATGVQAAARAARYDLLSASAARFRAARAISDDCVDPGLRRDDVAEGGSLVGGYSGEHATAAIVTAHTRDDQAETVLMRLARGSGLDGLAGMASVRPVDAHPGLAIIRPLLAIPGERLKSTLRALGHSWIDDPSNADETFERIRWRHGAPARTAAGLTNEHIALSARRLARARNALDQLTREVETFAVNRVPGLASIITRTAYAAMHPEVRVRILSRALALNGGAHPVARLADIERLADGLLILTGAATLGGCIVTPDETTLTITREPGRSGLPVLTLTPGTTKVWDQRFTVTLAADAPGPCLVRALMSAEWANVRAQFPRVALGQAPTQFPRVAPGQAPTQLPTHHLPPRLALTAPCFVHDDHVVGIPEVLAQADVSRHALCKAAKTTAARDSVVLFAGLCQAHPIR